MPDSRRSAGDPGVGPRRITGARCAWTMSSADADGRTEIRSRFTGFGDLLVDALRAVGADARLGPVPGEYCPGEFSVNDGHGHKLVGTAQRLVRGGWLFGTVIMVTDAEPVRSVLVACLPGARPGLDPGTVGLGAGHRARRDGRRRHTCGPGRLRAAG